MEARFAAVRGYLAMPSPLQMGDTYLAMLGDKAAFFIYVALTKGNGLASVTSSQVSTAMDIIHKSFAAPKHLQDMGDLAPNNSLALLKMFQAMAVDQAIKSRIVVETQYLNALPKSVAPDPMRSLGPPPAPGTTPFR